MNQAESGEIIARGFVLSVLNDDKKLAIKFIEAAANSEPFSILNGIANTIHSLREELVELDPEIGTLIDNICNAVKHDGCDCDTCRSKHQ